METRRMLGYALFGFLAASGSAQAAGGNPQEGRWKAETCMGCHAIPTYKNVYPTYYVPKLAGQHETYLVSALKEYRAHNRSHRTMQANVANLTDEDIADIAAYFSRNPGQ